MERWKRCITLHCIAMHRATLHRIYLFRQHLLVIQYGSDGVCKDKAIGDLFMVCRSWRSKGSHMTQSLVDDSIRINSRSVWKLGIGIEGILKLAQIVFVSQLCRSGRHIWCLHRCHCSDPLFAFRPLHWLSMMAGRIERRGGGRDRGCGPMMVKRLIESEDGTLHDAIVDSDGDALGQMMLLLMPMLRY